ncbi:uncharacterized protein N7525_001825 [Penicillium rubens]|uniref:uncharacterized protein n=1 Tax=Penicillium rubens TaxID=1108849 RepID=UPI002A5AA251|nr:uncharacterized protein N7525_001825 [Penicillium rubens]KAJ5844084.1 hypothetical protein N7525_001825 [Penicillium rubens]KAJ5845332.1 hypothetical protein N7534_009001 [Penicillium rubens]
MEGCWNLPSIMIIALRIYLSQENKRRDKLAEANRVASNGVVETVDSDGGKVARIVDNSQFDLGEFDVAFWIRIFGLEL